MPSLIYALILGTATMATSENLVRREHKAVSLHLGASGEMIGDSSGPQEQTDNTINTCDEVFPLGQLDKNACTEPNFDYPILNREVCIEAAREAGVMTVHSKFELQAGGGWRYKHPRGCFKVLCSEAHAGHASGADDAEKVAAENHANANNGGQCYFYNPVGENPPDGAGELTGAPVCYRPKIVNGTIADDTSSSPQGKVVQCRDDFSVIDNQNDCMAAAGCLGKCKGTEFQISLQVNSMYNNYPEGCFIHQQSGCVYINLRPNEVSGQASWGNPTNPVGTPLCNDAEVTKATTSPTPLTEEQAAPAPEEEAAPAEEEAPATPK